MTDCESKISELQSRIASLEGGEQKWISVEEPPKTSANVLIADTTNGLV